MSDALQRFFDVPALPLADGARLAIAIAIGVITLIVKVVSSAAKKQDEAQKRQLRDRIDDPPKPTSIDDRIAAARARAQARQGGNDRQRDDRDEASASQPGFVVPVSGGTVVVGDTSDDWQDDWQAQQREQRQQRDRAQRREAAAQRQQAEQAEQAKRRREKAQRLAREAAAKAEAAAERFQAAESARSRVQPSTGVGGTPNSPDSPGDRLLPLLRGRSIRTLFIAGEVLRPPVALRGDDDRR